MNMFKAGIYSLALSAFLLGCSSDSDDVGVAGSIFGKADSAVSTAGQTLPGAVTSSNINTLSVCDDSVTDLSSDASGAGEYLGCLLTVNSKNPETPLGSFHLVTVIMNMLESNISFTYDSAYTNHENISGTVDTSDGNQAVVVSLRERAVTGAWDFHVQLCLISIDGAPLNASLDSCIGGNFNFEMYLKDSDGQLGFKTVENFGGFAGGTSFLMDSNSGELRFESWDESNGRHARVYVSGAVSTSFDLSSVSAVEIAVASQGIENSGDGTDALYAEFDGTNLCINSFDDDDNNHGNGAGNGTTNLTAQGTCGGFPVYNSGFFTTGGLEAFLTDSTKGILNFSAASFGINSYFINN